MREQYKKDADAVYTTEVFVSPEGHVSVYVFRDGVSPFDLDSDGAYLGQNIGGRKLSKAIADAQNTLYERLRTRHAP